jgi:diamine N-acetyltransferase
MLFLTERLKINLMGREDLEDARKLHNDETVLSQLTDPTHVTEKMQYSWYENLSNSSTSLRYVCRSLDYGKLVGVFRIDNLDEINKSVMIGLDIAPEYRRMGFAVEIYNFFINYFFKEQEFHRVYLCTLESNLAAQSLYLKLGFALEGVQKEAILRNGSWVNLLNYSLLHDCKGLSF